MTRHDLDLDDEHRALLAASQRRIAPDAEAAARNFAAIGRRIAAGEPDPLAGEDVFEDMSQQTLVTHIPADMSGAAHERASVIDLGAHRRRTFFVALAAAAALIGALRLAQGLGITARGDAGGGDGSIAVDQPTPTSAGGDAHTRQPSPPRQAAPAPAEEPAPPAEAVPEDIPAPRRSPAPSALTTAAPADLAGELAMIRAAGEAARARDGALAQRLAEDYLAAHPGGGFAPEARVLRAEAMCLQGQAEQARAEAAALADALAGSPLAARARAICPQQ